MSRLRFNHVVGAALLGVFLLLDGGIGPPPTWSQSRRDSLAGSASTSCPGNNQMEMNECAAADYKKADAQLTIAYRKLEKIPKLIAAERAWIAYRDAECAYEHSAFEGGSMAAMVYWMCMTDLTNQRIAVLKGDSSDRSQ